MVKEIQMKVLKHGKLPEKKKCEWTCKNCLARVEAMKKEGEMLYDQRDGNAVIFVCPECKVENYVDEKLFK